MRKLFNCIFILAAVCLSQGCHQIEEWGKTPKDNFEALWTVIDQHYCFFGEKGIDWNEIHDRYAPRVYDDMSQRMLFQVCSEMVNELRDGHVNLSSYFQTSYYRKWWSDYPQNYDQRLVQQYYLDFRYTSLGPVTYAVLPQNIGYMHWSSFENSLGISNINAILGTFALCNGLIIDLRDNGGGNLTSAEDLARHFITKRTLAGYMINKTGPGHDDFSQPKEYYFDAPEAASLVWTKPVVILTNRSTYSAANNFVSIMQYLSNVTLVGAPTGGGSGMPLTMEIPVGWTIRMSAVSFLDAQGRSTENGIAPAPENRVDLDPVLAAQGIDTMLEKAIEVLNR